MAQQYYYLHSDLVDQLRGSGTSIRPFGAFFLESANNSNFISYNSLFGKGNYGAPDQSLVGNFELQDNTNSVVIADTSGNGRDGFLWNEGSPSPINTEDISFADGPTTYLPRSLHIPIKNGRYDPAEIAWGNSYGTSIPWADIPQSQGATFIGWVNMGVSHASVGQFKRLGNSNTLTPPAYSMGIANNPTASYQSMYTGDLSGTSLDVTPNTGVDRLNPQTWYHTTYTFEDSERSIYNNAELKATTTSGAAINYSSAGFYYGSDGYHAGLAVFNRKLTDDEISEAYAGPEPYAQSMPYVESGALSVGSTCKIHAGVWNSQNNGPITYTYTMYSYADYNGSSSLKEKEVTSLNPSQEILLNITELAGRYLGFTVTASNNGGKDPIEVYSFILPDPVGSGSVTNYISYNALFGLGKHLQDQAMFAHFKLDDDLSTSAAGSIYAASVVRNSLKVPRHTTRTGTLEDTSGNRIETSTVSTSGPTSWTPKAMNFRSGGGYYGIDIYGIASDLPSGSMTIMARAESEWMQNTQSIFSNSGNSGARGVFLSGSAYGTSNSRFVFGVQESVYGPAVAAASQYYARPSTGWKDVAGVFRSGTSVEMWVDGSIEQSTPTSLIYQANTTGNYGEASISFQGQHNTSGTVWDGSIADVVLFERDLSSDEIPEYSLGPEPINIVPPSVSGDTRVGYTLSISSGVWDSQLNGTVTKTYQWYRADDANGTNLAQISGATSSTYTLVIDDLEKYITVRERGTNDGGYDIAEDTFSSYTSEVALKGGMLLLKAG